MVNGGAAVLGDLRPMRLLEQTARRVIGLIGRESRIATRLRPFYESLLERASGGRGHPWSINGVEFRIDPHYRHMLGQHYDAEVAGFLNERVRPGDVCFDVGANVGVYVLQFAHWSRPDGRVIAFEPNPRTREVLAKHIRFNGYTERVRIVGAAVGAESGDATLFAAETDGMSRMGAPNLLIANQVESITVPVTTIDEFCEREGIVPRWLFIDIEGFEIQALRGAHRLIERYGAQVEIVVEMHPDVWSSAATTRAQAEAVISELGRRPVALQGQSDPLDDHGLVYLAPL